jgi:CheY-like chemotaxis protein
VASRRPVAKTALSGLVLIAGRAFPFGTQRLHWSFRRGDVKPQVAGQDAEMTTSCTTGLILIVDDDLDIREALSETLEDRGFQVVTAANGLEALKLLETMVVPPSVILLDLMMPVLDGYGFLAERRRHPELAAIPVAVITAGHGIDRARLGDSSLVVSKPINIPKLFDLLERLQSARGSAA